MNRNRSEADVLKGLHGTQGLWSLSLWPWPAELAGLGAHRGGLPFTLCADCPEGTHPLHSGTNSYYGERPLCLAHARARAAAEDSSTDGRVAHWPDVAPANRSAGRRAMVTSNRLPGRPSLDEPSPGGEV